MREMLSPFAGSIAGCPVSPLADPMTPPSLRPASFEAWQAVTAPGDVFRHPREVLAHPLLSNGEKRAILAAWASDACALENAPGLRCLSGTRAEPVPVDSVLAALTALDTEGLPEKAPGSPAQSLPPLRPRRLSSLHRPGRFGRRDDDDDDPPPCPAVARPCPRGPTGSAASAVGAPA